MEREVVIAKVMSKLADNATKFDKTINAIIDGKVPALSVPRYIKTYFETSKLTKDDMVAFLDRCVKLGVHKMSSKHEEGIMLVSKIFGLGYKIKPFGVPAHP